MVFKVNISRSVDIISLHQMFEIYKEKKRSLSYYQFIPLIYIRNKERKENENVEFVICIHNTSRISQE